MKSIKLFCIPHAGGSATNYIKWNRYFDDTIKLCPIEIAGRGRRFDETLISEMDLMVNDIYNTIKKEINSSEYAIFGHSMGSIIAFELYHKIKEQGMKEPVHIFFSARTSPDICKDKDIMHKLPYERFIKEIYKIGGTSVDIFENKELCNIFVPILRSDYKLIETYKYTEKNVLIDCDITILYGEQDQSIELEYLNEWQKHTRQKCIIKGFPGGHFFINEKIEEVINLINITLIHNRYKAN